MMRPYWTGKHHGKHVEFCSLWHGLPTPAMRAWIKAGETEEHLTRVFESIAIAAELPFPWGRGQEQSK